MRRGDNLCKQRENTQNCTIRSIALTESYIQKGIIKKKCEEEKEMDLVQLTDGQIDTVGNKHHVIDIVRKKCGDDIARIISQWIDPKNTGEMRKWRDSFKEEFEEEKRQEEMAIIEKLNKIYCT